MQKYAVYFEGDFQAEFDSLEEALQYMKRDIEGMASFYGHSLKWIKSHFTWSVEVMDYGES